MPLRTVKTILHELVQELGSPIMKMVAVALPASETSYAASYIKVSFASYTIRRSLISVAVEVQVICFVKNSETFT